jgi:hypothetical protein
VIQEIGPSIFVETEFHGANVAFIVTDEGMILIDTPLLPDYARLWRREIGRRTDQLDTLRGKPRQLAKDYKERQETVWEKLRTGRPVATAEAVRDLAWHGQHADLTKKDSELLQRGQGFLAAEMALVSDIEVSEASKRIESALAVAATTAQ